MDSIDFPKILDTSGHTFILWTFSSFTSRILFPPKAQTWFLTALSQIPVRTPFLLATLQAALQKIPSSSPLPTSIASHSTHLSCGITSTAIILANSNILMILKSNLPVCHKYQTYISNSVTGFFICQINSARQRSQAYVVLLLPTLPFCARSTCQSPFHPSEPPWDYPCNFPYPVLIFWHLGAHGSFLDLLAGSPIVGLCPHNPALL